MTKEAMRRELIRRMNRLDGALSDEEWLKVMEEVTFLIHRMPK